MAIAAAATEARPVKEGQVAEITFSEADQTYITQQS
jgi:hypothetical protein